MARPSRRGGKTRVAKTRKAGSVKGRTPGRTKRRTAPSATRLKRSPVSRLGKELKEAREQQAATAEILKVIASSPDDVQPVFEAIAASAKRLMGGYSAAMFRFIDGVAYLKAFTPTTPEANETLHNDFPMPVSNFPLAQQVLNGGTEQIPDTETSKEFQIRIARARGFRSIMFSPLMHQGTAIGMITITRREPGRFADHHVQLLRTFADQAVIAIENTRLFNEVQAKSNALAEALTYQSASGNILSVIASSPTKVEPALQAIVESACKLCDSYDTGLLLKIGDDLHYSAHHGPIPIGLSKWPINRRWVTGRCVVDKTTLQVSDLLSEEGDDFPEGRDHSRRMGHRCILAVPLLREGEAVGAIALRRLEPVPFSEKQISLLQTFADQAVIAIENARLFNETQEALARQTATSDVLRVISSSVADTTPVFEKILDSCEKLFATEQLGIFVMQPDGQVHAGAWRGAALEAVIQTLPRPVEQTATGIVIQNRGVLHFPSTALAKDLPRTVRDLKDQIGDSSMAWAPMLGEEHGVGSICVMRQPPSPFSDKELALLKTFADQAVIAIQNTRLFNETKEALERQTATADILKVIASSPSNVQPVFEAIAESAKRLLGSHHAVVTRVIDDTVHLAAFTAGDEEGDKALQSRFPMPLSGPGPNSRAARTGEIERVTDTETYLDSSDDFKESARARGFRSVLVVPMLRNGVAIGTIATSRRQPGSFAAKEIDLLRTFADQAVIAIENARLFEELRERQAELARSVDELTATSDVLKIISRSTVDLETVLDTLVETLAQLFGADNATMYRRRDDNFYLIASRGLSEGGKALARTYPVGPNRGSLIGRIEMERRPVQIADVLCDPEYTHHELQKILGYRSTLGVPLLRENTLLGIFAINRIRVEPFTEKEIELASTFADQAVIAIENARLFEELRERQAELRVTFDNMGDGVVMFDAAARLTAWNRNFQEMLELPEAFLARRPGVVEFFRYLADRGEYSADLEAQLSRTIDDLSLELRFERTRPDGRIIEVRRNPVPGGGFVLIYADITTRKQAEDAIRAARDAAETTLRDLQTAQTSLVHAQKMAALGQLTAGIAHEIKNPLNFVNNFSELSVELAEELNEVLKQASLADKLRKEADELTSLLKDNLGKVVQHGKRADSIVKNMLLHSREGSGECRAVDINALVDESLNLAYHGARAEKQGFNISLEREFDPTVGTAEVYPQEITRVFLNLISNGFYAANKRVAEAGSEPRLKATTRNLGENVEIRFRDNGVGIPPDIREKIFNPFFTTKPAGEGTGLGLSLSHDIVVKQHNGTIEVATEPGSFAEFIVRLPRTMADGKSRGAK
jgi:PAS domain S-box-containing protein